MHKMKLHHIAVACKNMDKQFAVYETLGYKRDDTEDFVDEIQKIRGRFISAEGQPRLELLENLYDCGPLDSCLENGIKYYHLAYESENIEQDIEMLANELKAKVIVPVTPAAYFERICFLMLPCQTMIELVELKKGEI